MSPLHPARSAAPPPRSHLALPIRWLRRPGAPEAITAACRPARRDQLRSPRHQAHDKTIGQTPPMAIARRDQQDRTCKRAQTTHCARKSGHSRRGRSSRKAVLKDGLSPGIGSVLSENGCFRESPDDRLPSLFVCLGSWRIEEPVARVIDETKQTTKKILHAIPPWPRLLRLGPYFGGCGQNYFLSNGRATPNSAFGYARVLFLRPLKVGIEGVSRNHQSGAG